MAKIWLLILYISIVIISPIYSAYDEPEIEFENIPAIVINRKTKVTYTIEMPDGSEKKGTFYVEGTSSGKNVPLPGTPSTKKVKYKYYFPNGGWQYKTKSFSLELTTDVVKMINIDGKSIIVRSFDYDYTAITNPPNYGKSSVWSGDAGEHSGEIFPINFPSNSVKKVSTLAEINGKSSNAIQKSIIVKAYDFDFSIAVSVKPHFYDKNITFKFIESTDNKNVKCSNHKWALPGGDPSSSSAKIVNAKWKLPPENKAAINKAKAAVLAKLSIMKADLAKLKKKYIKSKLENDAYVNNVFTPAVEKLNSSSDKTIEKVNELADVFKRKKIITINLSVTGTSTIDKSKKRILPKDKSITLEMELSDDLNKLIGEINAAPGKISQLKNEINDLKAERKKIDKKLANKNIGWWDEKLLKAKKVAKGAQIILKLNNGMNTTDNLIKNIENFLSKI